VHVGSKRLLVVALVAVAAVPWVFVVRTLKDAKPLPVRTARPTSVVWDNRVFDSQHALAAWLRSRGASYEKWAAAHRELARIFNPGAAPAPQTTRAAAPAAPARTNAAPQPHAQSKTTSGSGVDASGLLRRLLILAAKVATALLILALVVFSLGPDRLIVRVRPELTATTGTVELRAAAFAAAVSLTVGLLAAQLL